MIASQTRATVNTTQTNDLTNSTVHLQRLQKAFGVCLGSWLKRKRKEQKGIYFSFTQSQQKGDILLLFIAKRHSRKLAIKLLPTDRAWHIPSRQTACLHSSQHIRPSTSRLKETANW
jgi:hypothetical protein